MVILSICFLVLSNVLVADERPEQMLQRLSMREKIGQLFVVAAASCLDQPTESLAASLKKSPYHMDEAYLLDLIKHYNVGGVIFLYKSTPEEQMKLMRRFQQAAKIPLLITQDSEWGLSLRLDL